MKVLLVSANRKDFPDPVYPLGISLVAAAAERDGHQVRVVDLRWGEEPLAPIIAAWAPDVVGLGVRNLDNLTWGRSVTYLPEIRAVVAEIRSVFRGPMVLGGSGYSLFPEALLDRLDVPYGVVGEGEDAFPALLDALDGRRETAGIPGVAVRGATIAPAPSRQDVAPGRNPLRRALAERYAGRGAAIGVQTKRGCPFRCTYCTYPNLEGAALRLRAPDDVVDEVEELVGAGVRSVFFVDDTFNVPGDHAEAVCRRLVERGVQVSWSAFGHPSRLTPELAGWMKRAGCSGLEFGSDSLCDGVLQELRKGFTVEDVRAAHRTAAQASLPVAHYLLLGSPGETPDTLAQTLREADRLPPAAYIAMLGVRLYPETELTHRARDEGIIGKDQDLVEPAFYFSPGVEVAAVSDGVRAHARQRRNWIVPSLGIRSEPAVLDRVRQRGAGPTWGALLR